MATAINKIVQNLKPFKPEKVVLFGSRAWGKPKKDSDFDLFIIKKTRQNPAQRSYKVRQYLNDINESFDILIFTPQEIQNRLDINDFFVKDIMEKGKVIYEKA